MQDRVPFLGRASVRLFGLLLLVLLPLVGHDIYQAMQRREAAIVEARARLQQFADTIATDYRAALTDARDVLATAAAAPSLTDDRCDAFLTRLTGLFPFLSNITLVDLDGRRRCGSRSDSATATPLPGLAARHGGAAPLLGRIVPGPDDRAMMILALPFQPNGSLAGMLGAGLSLDWLNDQIGRLRLPPGMAITVFDDSGRLLSQWPSADVAPGTSVVGWPAVRLALGHRRDRYRTEAGEERLVAYSQVSGLPVDLYVLAEQPLTIVLAPLEQAATVRLILLAVVAVVSLILTWLVARDLFLGWVGGLSALAGRLARGDLGARSGLPHINTEMGRLAEAFDHMADELEARDAELQAANRELDDLLAQRGRQLRTSEARFLALVQALPHGVAEIDDEGRVAFANVALHRLLGVPEGDLIGRPAWERVPSPSERDALAERVALPAPEADGPLEVAQETTGGHQRITQIDLVRGRHEDGVGVVAVVTDITRRRTAEQALARHHRELEEAVVRRTADLARTNAELEQFAYLASHDLREPLRTVASYLQLLEMRQAAALDEDGRTFLQFALAGARRMHRQVEDLQAYFNIGRMDRSPGPARLAELITRAVDQCRPDITAAGAQVTVAPDLPRLNVVTAEIVLLFTHLIDNAIKYRDPARPCTVTIDRVEDDAPEGGCHLRIADNGIGVAPEHAERIFRIFQRLHGRDTYPGTGIGLAMCRKIAERHGGRIWVTGRDDGPGCVFHIVLSDMEDSQSPDLPAVAVNS